MERLQRSGSGIYCISYGGTLQANPCIHVKITDAVSVPASTLITNFTLMLEVQLQQSHEDTLLHASH